MGCIFSSHRGQYPSASTNRKAFSVIAQLPPSEQERAREIWIRSCQTHQLEYLHKSLKEHGIFDPWPRKQPEIWPEWRKRRLTLARYWNTIGRDRVKKAMREAKEKALKQAEENKKNYPIKRPRDYEAAQQAYDKEVGRIEATYLEWELGTIRLFKGL